MRSLVEDGSAAGGATSAASTAAAAAASSAGTPSSAAAGTSEGPATAAGSAGDTPLATALLSLRLRLLPDGSSSSRTTTASGMTVAPLGELWSTTTGGLAAVVAARLSFDLRRRFDGWLGVLGLVELEPEAEAEPEVPEEERGGSCDAS